jgi:hypothetical protein
MTVLPFEEAREISIRVQQDHDPSDKQAVFTSLSDTLFINSLSQKSVQLSVCKEVFTSLPVVIYSPKNFFLLEKLSEHIEELKAAGLVELWDKQSLKRNSHDHEVNLRQLTLHDFKGCFAIILIGISTSFAVFSGEILMKIVERKRKCSDSLD